MSYSIGNTNIHPYYDDFDKDKNFLRMLFNPARAVQARELTQLQTVLQNQVSQFSDHIFKDGTAILGGDVKTKTNPHITVTTADIVIEGTTNTQLSSVLIGRHIRGSVSNALAEVVAVEDIATETRIQLLVRGGTWQVGEFFLTEDYGDDIFVTHYELLDTGSGIASVGEAIKAVMDTGIVYIGGMYVIITEDQNREEYVQSDAVAISDEYKIGYLLTENVVTFLEDETLEEPASGTNHGAYGADRYQPTVTLASYKTVGTNAVTPPDNFYKVLHIRVDDTDTDITHTLYKQRKTEYADIMEMLERRTYDESGSYTIKPYKAFTKEISLTDINFKYIVNAGKSYIFGRELETFSPQTIITSKGRTSFQSVSDTVQMNFSSYVTVDVNSNLASDLIGKVQGLFNPLTPIDVEIHNAEYADTSADTKLGETQVLFVSKSGSLYRIYMSGEKDVRGLLQEAKCIKNTAGTIYFDRVKYNLDQVSKINSTIVELPNSPVKSMGAITYDSEQTITSKSVTLGSSFTLVLTGSNRFVDGTGIANFIGIINESTGAWVEISGSTSITDDSVQQITVGSAHGITDGTYSFILKTIRYQVSARTKELREEIAHVFTTDANGEYKFTSESFYDIIDIQNVKLNDGSETDETAFIQFDNGQRDYFYDYGSIKGLTASREYKADIYRFFHNTSGAGDFFSISSYDTAYNNAVSYYNDKGGAYAFIPVYTNNAGSRTFSLRSCLDFRRNATELSGTRYMARPSDFVDITYDIYLSRKDKIWIDKNGTFGVTRGIASLDPKLPPEKANTLSLYNVDVPAYVFQAENVSLSMINTKNYTMSDIHKLEKRISNIEYYESVSQLQTDASALNIVDALGLPRSKHGIFVDGFTDHSKGEVSNAWYRNSMDFELGILRCPFTMDNVGMKYTSGGTNIKVHDNTITLDYTIEDFIVQPLATGSINVNPYDVMIWTGEVTLAPLSDYWVDTVHLPAKIVDTYTHTSSTNIINQNITQNFGRDWRGLRWGWGFGRMFPQNRWGRWFGGIWGWRNNNFRRWRPDGVGRRFLPFLCRMQDNRFFTEGFGRIASPIIGRWCNRTPNTNTNTTTTIDTDITYGDVIITDMGERIVDISEIPYMREIDIDFIAKGMKPDTEVYVFFTDIDITTDYCFAWDSGTSTYKKINGTSIILETDFNGTVKGKFRVPVETFRTGENIFELKDSVTNFDTFAATGFNTGGVLETKQTTINVEHPIHTTTTITNVTTVERQQPRWREPIAETFLVATDDEQGAFIKEIDIFFMTKDNGIPISLEIVEVENGYPSQKVLPFGKCVLDAHEINATWYDTDDSTFKYKSTHYEADGTTVKYTKDQVVSGQTDFKPTTFTFTDPVFLKENTEYAFVMVANSPNYRVYTTTMGDNDILTDERIIKQPYLGSLFKSQNASTWTTDQNMDIKFNLKRCEFTTNLADLNMYGDLVADPWDTLVNYIFEPEADTADRIQVGYDGILYELIADANSASDNPSINTTSWIPLREAEHDITLVTPSVENMLLPNTYMTHSIKLNSSDSLIEFVNKENVNLSSMKTISEINEAVLTQQPIIAITDMASDSTFITPIINRNRSSMAIVNNVVVPLTVTEEFFHDYTGDVANVQFDSGKYISETTVLSTPATDLRVLIDTYQIDSDVDVTVKFKTLNADKRYMLIDTNLTTIYEDSLRDSILYVYHFDDALAGEGLAVTNWFSKSQVVIDGFGEVSTDPVIFASSIGDNTDFTHTGTNPKIFITSEADIVQDDIFDYDVATYTTGDYVIYNNEMYVYLGAGTADAPTPSKDGTDWLFIEGVFIDVASTVNVYTPDWQEMYQINKIPDGFDLESSFVERTFSPKVTPSESFDSFAVMIEMWSNDEVSVPLVQRLRAIAVD